ncbi:MAG: glycosyltransferase, partial [Candidatus Omnitrophota bacterium]
YDLSRWNWQRKAKSWKNLDLTIVTPSTWLARRAKESSLFKNRRIEIIANGIDTNVYKPVDKKTSRSMLNLSQNKLLILFGAMSPLGDYRKGFHLLQPALQNLSKSGWGAKVEIVIFGASKPENPKDLGLKTNYLGYLKDDISMVLAYSAADVMMVPSIQEAFGQTASESLACGTPVVAFDTSGLKDIVEHQKNGYLARPHEVEDLAKGIIWVLEDEQRRRNLSLRAREKAEEEFSLETQTRAYLKLYEEILQKTSSI